jgi:hypothetical protein
MYFDKVFGLLKYTVLQMSVTIFWDIAPHSLFQGTYHLHLQGRKLAEQVARQ